MLWRWFSLKYSIEVRQNQLKSFLILALLYLLCYDLNLTVFRIFWKRGFKMYVRHWRIFVVWKDIDTFFSSLKFNRWNRILEEFGCLPINEPNLSMKIKPFTCYLMPVQIHRYFHRFNMILITCWLVVKLLYALIRHFFFLFFSSVGITVGFFINKKHSANIKRLG